MAVIVNRENRVGLGHVPALDGVRGVAIICVLLFHAAGHHFPGGWVGVHIFFVLSGFLITTLLLQEMQERGHLSLVAFWIRRVLRLAPALAIMIAIFVVYALATTHGANLHQQLRSAEIAATYRANLPGGGAYVGAKGDLSFTWTLALEEQFYVVWPLVLILLARGRVSPRRLMTLTAVAAVGLAVWRAGLALDGVSVNHLYFRPDTTADSLLFGCLGAQAYVYRILPVRRVLRWASVVAATCVAVVVLSADISARWSYVLPLPLLTATSALALIALVEGHAPMADRLIGQPILRWIGRVSYSLYLWNGLVEDIFHRDWHGSHLLRDLMVMVISFGIAALSYYLVERPFIGMRRRLHQPNALHRH